MNDNFLNYNELHENSPALGDYVKFLCNSLLSKILTFLFTLISFPLEAIGFQSGHPALTQEQNERAFAKFEEHKAFLARSKEKNNVKSSPIPDPAFQGWWKMETRGNEHGFGFGALTDDIDSYVFIDFSQFDPDINPFIEIKTTCGTPIFPRECTPLDVGKGIKGNLYYVPSSTQLVNIFDLNGPAFDPTIGQSKWSLELQADKETIVASSDSQPQWVGYSVTSTLLRKVQEPPPVRPYDDTETSFPSVTDPVEMAKYIYNALELNYNQPQNIHLKDRDYRCFERRQAIFHRMLTKGISYETKIRKMRVRDRVCMIVIFLTLFQHLAFFRQMIQFPFISTNALTDIFTDEFSYALAGSTIEIKGFKGKWENSMGTMSMGLQFTKKGVFPIQALNMWMYLLAKSQKKVRFVKSITSSCSTLIQVIAKNFRR